MTCSDSTFVFSVFDTRDSSPVGSVVVSDGPLAEENPFQFSTKYTDSETKLVYYGYRYLDTGTGRWVSRDPVGTSSEYCVVENSPVDSVDALGLYTFSVDTAEVAIGMEAHEPNEGKVHRDMLDAPYGGKEVRGTWRQTDFGGTGQSYFRMWADATKWLRKYRKKGIGDLQPCGRFDMVVYLQPEESDKGKCYQADVQWNGAVSLTPAAAGIYNWNAKVVVSAFGKKGVLRGMGNNKAPGDDPPRPSSDQEGDTPPYKSGCFQLNQKTSILTATSRINLYTRYQGKVEAENSVIFLVTVKPCSHP